MIKVQKPTLTDKILDKSIDRCASSFKSTSGETLFLLSMRRNRKIDVTPMTRRIGHDRILKIESDFALSLLLLMMVPL